MHPSAGETGDAVALHTLPAVGSNVDTSRPFSITRSAPSPKGRTTDANTQPAVQERICPSMHQNDMCVSCSGSSGSTQPSPASQQGSPGATTSDSERLVVSRRVTYSSIKRKGPDGILARSGCPGTQQDRNIQPFALRLLERLPALKRRLLPS